MKSSIIYLIPIVLCIVTVAVGYKRLKKEEPSFNARLNDYSLFYGGILGTIVLLLAYLEIIPIR